MVRRRGLVRSAARTAARTAVIAGTATSVAGRVARRQQQQHGRPVEAASKQHSGAAHVHSSAGDDVVDKLQHLADLKAAGALSEKEYTAAKAKVLAI